MKDPSQNPDSNELPRFVLEAADDLRAIYDALERRDDSWLQDAAARASRQDSFFEHLRGQVGYTTYVAAAKRGGHRVEINSALILIPVLLQPAAASFLSDGSKELRPTISLIRSNLQDWLGYQVEVTLYSAPIAYDEICMWTPSMMREKLEHLALRKQPSLKVESRADFKLPEGSPTLAFLAGAISKPLTWPTLPMAEAMPDVRLRQRIEAAIDVAVPNRSVSGSCRVLAPDFAAEAIQAGIEAWIPALREYCGARLWDVEMYNQDTVIVHLQADEEAAKTCAVPLRAHQVGLDGIQSIVNVAGQHGQTVQATRH